MSKVFLLWAYTEAIVYGTKSVNRDVLKVFKEEDEDLAWATMRKLESTVGKKFNATYSIEAKELEA